MSGKEFAPVNIFDVGAPARNEKRLNEWYSNWEKKGGDKGGRLSEMVK